MIIYYIFIDRPTHLYIHFIISTKYFHLSDRKRLDAELIRRGYTDIHQKRYPIGYQEAPLAYDAVWSVALAFNKTMEQLKRKDKKRSLKDFTYTESDIAGEIYAAMNSTSFLGVSVRV